jgi:hypothetical protein
VAGIVPLHVSAADVVGISAMELVVVVSHR